MCCVKLTFWRKGVMLFAMLLILLPTNAIGICPSGEVESHVEATEAQSDYTMRRFAESSSILSTGLGDTDSLSAPPSKLPLPSSIPSRSATPTSPPSASTPPPSEPTTTPSEPTTLQFEPPIPPSEPSAPPSKLPWPSAIPSGSATPTSPPSEPTPPPSEPTTTPSEPTTPPFEPTFPPSEPTAPPSKLPWPSAIPSGSATPTPSITPSSVPLPPISDPSGNPTTMPTTSVEPSAVPFVPPSVSPLPSSVPSDVPTTSVAPSSSPTLCDCPDEAELLMWNDKGKTEVSNNCYNYATNSKTSTCAQPGSATMGAIDDTEKTCKGGDPYSTPIAVRALADGLKKPVVGTMRECPEDFCLVALYINEGIDFHWMRWNDDGTWSHKRGIRPAELQAGNPPGGGSYDFCAFMCTPWNLNLPGDNTASFRRAIRLSRHSGVADPEISVLGESRDVLLMEKLRAAAKDFSGLPPPSLSPAPLTSEESSYNGFYVNGTNLEFVEVLGDSGLYTEDSSYMRVFNGTIEVVPNAAAGASVFYLEDTGGVEAYLQGLAIEQGHVSREFFGPFSSPAPSSTPTTMPTTIATPSAVPTDTVSSCCDPNLPLLCLVGQAGCCPGGTWVCPDEATTKYQCASVLFYQVPEGQICGREQNQKFVYSQPSWFSRIKKSFEGIKLKKCRKRQFPPGEGSRCSRKPSSCFFGEQDCPRVGPHPTIKCECSGRTSGRRRGTWSCVHESCTP